MTGAVHVIVREYADHILVSPQGPLYYDTLEPLRDVLLMLGSSERPRLVLDLSDVTICDSSGLNLFALTHRRAAEHGGWLRLAAPQPIVLKVMVAANLTRL